MSAQQNWTPDVRPPADTRRGVGARLRQAREARGLTFDVIATQTKIPPHHLEAIERGTSALPVFYQRAEIRAFARAVGVDERLALSQLEPPEEPIEPPAPERPQWTLVVPAQVRSHLQSALALLLAALAGAVLARTVFPPTVESSSDERTSAAAPASEFSRTLGSGLAEATEVSVPAPAPQPPASALAAAAAASGASIVEPPRAGATTELVVTSEPAGARVTVNGIGWGTTPVAIRHLTPGNKRIRVTKDGYAASERALSVAEGSRRALDVQLTALP